MKKWSVRLALLSFAMLAFSTTVSLQAQSSPPTAVPGFYAGLDATNQQLRRGEAVFYQRCSLCHLPRIRKGGTTPGPAPNLSGILKSGAADREAKVRAVIMNGSDRMPAWQYGLKPGQIDDVIAYLKTL